jgi:putative RNA 2'-phosphotransferase
MDRQRNVRISKFLSRVLRHRPEQIGINLSDAGWVEVDELLAACRRHGIELTREELDEVVATNDKQRFAFSEDGKRVRATQGHSIPVELGYRPVMPPETLYHGTAERNLMSIRQHGLKRGRRRQVHLSPDPETAVKVGQRHGKPVVFRVNARAMHDDGHEFFLSVNGVWLTDHVPADYISLAE